MHGINVLTENSQTIIEPADTYLSDSEDVTPLRCWECNVNFTSKHYLYDHLLYHIKQPRIQLRRVDLLPIKITLKSTSKNRFEIVSPPLTSPTRQEKHFREIEQSESKILAETTDSSAENPECSAEEYDSEYKDGTENDLPENIADENIEYNDVFFPPDCSENENGGLTVEEGLDDNLASDNIETEQDNVAEYGNIPGAEPTPPPEPSPEYPKIRIKSGLLKESSVSITEITENHTNKNSKNEESFYFGSNKQSTTNRSNVWSTDDRLNNEKEDGNLFSLFSKNNERAKDLGFTTSDSEFISLDRLDDRHQNALQVYSSHNSQNMNQSPLDSLTGLPMQQLAQQVSRLQPPKGMHQQNVLINIQQFPTPTQSAPHAYQPPPMYHPPQPPPPMYPAYQYQPHPNHMYYPPGPGYPPPQNMPPPPQMPQRAQQSMNPHAQQMMNSHHQMQQNNSYSQQQMPRPPRPPMPQQRPMSPRQSMQPRQAMQPRQPHMPRQRAPMSRPRGGGMGVRGPRPRMPAVQQNQQIPPKQAIKRPADQQIPIKRKKIDILVPDKNDDADCQVICTQPKNTDGGLPQITSVQGGTGDLNEGNVMHLSDSITLSVRNSQQKPPSPKTTSDAKDVANILATRGITVTATPKQKEKVQENTKNNPSLPPPPPPPVAINLNSAVSIIPTSKQTNNPNSSSSNNNTSNGTTMESRLPTVDLTEETASDQPALPPPKKPLPQQTKSALAKLSHRCDLCPAKYPNATGLNKHRQMFHKVGGGGPCETGIPVINLKQPGVLQKLSNIGIFNYIPLPGPSSDGMFGIPIVNMKNPANINALGSDLVLTLGPMKYTKIIAEQCK